MMAWLPGGMKACWGDCLMAWLRDNGIAIASLRGNGDCNEFVKAEVVALAMVVGEVAVKKVDVEVATKMHLALQMDRRTDR